MIRTINKLLLAAAIIAVLIAISMEARVRRVEREKAAPPPALIESFGPVKLNPGMTWPNAYVIRDKATDHDYLVIDNGQRLTCTPMLSDPLPTSQSLSAETEF